MSRFQRRTMPRQQAPAAPPSGQTADTTIYAAAPAAPAVPSGPTVRVTRGQTTTVEAAGRTGTAALAAVR